MEEAYVRLLCPDCTKDWETRPNGLPSARESFRCPDCAAERPLSEFMRTERDLETLRSLG